ncbi:MAG TPA: DNA alkylation repair protein [Aggregatilineales bacterium]|nr:DNA alkylation repair protein [Anaerolineales bacterium]HRE46520.1 DNA alkylation repair protein [Aggregatilineales bacterium]
MNTAEIMAALEAAGTAQNRKIAKRHGVDDNVFGVLRSEVNKLVKQIKINHTAALELWETGNFDARTVATMIADPQKIDEATLTHWGETTHDYGTAGEVSNIIAKTPYIRAFMERWTNDEGEWLGRIGWLLLSHLAAGDNSLPDSFFLPYLATIEEGIHTAKNRTRDAMNTALISIGTRNAALEGPAYAAAKRIGRVEVDHGQTDCETPLAIPYMDRIKAHRAKRAAEKEAKSAAAKATKGKK